MLRLLHTADWQIGRHYGRFPPEDAAALADARFLTVERLAQLATERQVHAVLVAGDVFDTQTVSERTIRRLFLALQGYAGPWLLLPGNHDAALAEGVWQTVRRLNLAPANVHVLDQAGATLFAEAGFAALAAPLTQRQTFADLTAPFDAWETPAGLLRIGLAHGSVQGLLAEGIDSPNPIAPDRADSARLDYLALGDWHGTRCVNARTWYAGTPEPDRFRNNDAGQALLIELDASSPPRVEVLPTARYTWHEWQVALQVATDVDALMTRLAALPAAAVLSLHISGSITLADQQRLQGALAEALARHRSVQWHTQGLRLLPTDADLADLQADGYLTDVVTELRDCQQGPQAEVAREALAILAHLLQSAAPSGGRSCA